MAKASGTDLPTSLSFPEQLSQLQKLLRKKDEICSDLSNPGTEEVDEEKRRREKRDADQEDLMQKLAKVMSEKREESIGKIEDSNTADVSSELLPVLEELNRERQADLTSFARELHDTRGEYQQRLLAALARRP